MSEQPVAFEKPNMGPTELRAKIAELQQSAESLRRRQSDPDGAKEVEEEIASLREQLEALEEAGNTTQIDTDEETPSTSPPQSEKEISGPPLSEILRKRYGSNQEEQEKLERKKAAAEHELKKIRRQLGEKGSGA